MNPRDFRVWWAGTERGWIIDTEFGLSRPTMQRIADYTTTIQKQRLVGLLPGAKRDECVETITALEAGRIQQNIVGIGDHVVYDAYKSDEKKVIIT